MHKHFVFMYRGYMFLLYIFLLNLIMISHNFDTIIHMECFLLSCFVDVIIKDIVLCKPFASNHFNFLNHIRMLASYFNVGTTCLLLL